MPTSSQNYRKFIRNFSEHRGQRSLQERYFYGGIVGTALAAVRKNTKFNWRIVGATLRGRPNGIIYNAEKSAQRRAGAI